MLRKTYKVHVDIDDDNNSTNCADETQLPASKNCFSDSDDDDEYWMKSIFADSQTSISSPPSRSTDELKCLEDGEELNDLVIDGSLQ